jgi:murein DD-endopeptidase MepM/ murein hydrolase activator NlpD
MIGLAVSVGTCGLPISHQGDQAVAAEPASADSTADVATNFEAAAVLSVDEVTQSSTSLNASQSVQHTVQEGQTLWDVARFYGTDASILASVNGLSLNSVLRVGQVLSVPVDTRIAQATGAENASVMPGYYGHVSTLLSSSRTASTPSKVDSQAKVDQDQATETLKQKREALRSELARLNLNTPQSQPVGGEAIQKDSSIVVASTIDPAINDASKEIQANRPAANEQKVAFQSPNQFSGANVGSVGVVTHRVVPGDTLASIARANGVSVRQLLEMNRISNPNYILVGQSIVIPASQSATVSQPRLQGAIAAVPSTIVTDVPTSTFQSRITPPPTAESDEQVAAVTTFSTPSSVDVEDSGSRLLQYNHVQNLKLEIDRLREKYQAQSGRSPVATRVEATVAAATPRVQATPLVTSEPINPEFNPERYSARMQEIRDRIRHGDRVQSAMSTRVQTPQVMAAAPLGSESYDPIKSRLGRTVSPELPSLGTGSEFLPSVPGQQNGFIWPTKGVLTSGYGWRWGRMHKGIDIAGPIGTPVVAAAEGRVSYAGWNSGGYGYLVEIQHSDGSMTLYAHNNRILVQVGQEVEQGQQIAEMGSTGYSTGPHLHFEIHPTGRGAVNPMPFLQARR